MECNIHAPLIFVLEVELMPDERKTNEEEQREGIEKSGEVTTHNPRGNIKCITIVGQVEGHQLLNDGSKTTKYEHILPQLVAIEEDPEIDGLLILLNTCGGDVEAGLAIAEMISGMKKPTVSLVLGGSHSIGVPLAVAAKYSFIAPSATMTVHPLRMTGMVIGVMQTFRYFERMQERITDFVVRNSDIDYEDFRRLMLTTEDIANDVGTILFADKAVEWGLINSMGGVNDALEMLYYMI